MSRETLFSLIQADAHNFLLQFDDIGLLIPLTSLQEQLEVNTLYKLVEKSANVTHIGVVRND